MKYIEFVNQAIRREISKKRGLVAFGQNIAAGSCLGGLAKGLAVELPGKIINSLNSENSLCGFGFGLMMGGSNAVFFMKQLDFLLLGLDHLVNTYNIIRNSNEHYKGSFTIVPIIVDNGFQGPQSSLNNLADICSLARIPGYAVTNKWDAEKIISEALVSPGFRIIGASQRLFQKDIIEPQSPIWHGGMGLAQYSKGDDATIVSFNFSFPLAYELLGEMRSHGLSASLFNVNSATPVDWGPILADVRKTNNLVALDDSKSENLPMFSLLAGMHGIDLRNKILIKREFSDGWLNPAHDQLEADFKNIIRALKV